MATFLTDSLEEASDTNLQGHTGELGASWTKHPSFSATPNFTIIAATGRLYHSNSNAAQCYYASGVPASADYYVESVAHYLTSADSSIGGAGRIDISAETLYFWRYIASTTLWTLRKSVAGVASTLGTYSQSLSAGVDYTVRMDMVGTTIRLLIDGVERVNVTDSAISAAGRAGFRSAGQIGSTVGYQIASISGVDTSGGAGGDLLLRLMGENLYVGMAA